MIDYISFFEKQLERVNYSWTKQFSRVRIAFFADSQNIRITVGRLLIFQQSARFLWANLAQLIGKYRCGQRGQPALTSTRTLLSGTTICSCLVGTGGYLYCRRTF